MIKELVYGRSNPLPAGTSTLEDVDELRDALTKIGLGLDAYVARLSDRDPQIPLLLLLVMSPNLERYHTMRGFSGIGIQALFDRVATKNIEAACNNAPPCDFLSHLKSIEIGPSQHNIGVAQALTLLTLPRLDSLQVHGLQHRDGRASGALPSHDGVVRNDSPRLRLHFDGCELSEMGLALILQACRRTRALTIRWLAGLWVNREYELHIDRIAAMIQQHGAHLQELVLDYTNPWLTPVGNVRHEQQSLGHMIDREHTSLGIPYSSFAGILQNTPAADQTAAIAASLPRNLQKLYILGTADGDQATPFLALQNLIPCLMSVICVPLVEYHDGKYNCRCVDYRAARELGLPLVCEQEGYELLPGAGTTGWRSGRSQTYGVQDYYDQVA